MKITDCYKIEEGAKQYNFNKCLQFLWHIGRQKYGTSFRIYKEDVPILFRLLVYAIGDEENCARHNLDLKKGILLTGPVGCGKTSLMSLLPEFMYQEQRFTVKNTRDVAAEFNKEGYEIIQKYGYRPKVICLDDLGVEQSSRYYGNECNTIGEILLHRYELYSRQRIVTHATTNLNAAELEKGYGNRVRSRMREMFNLISFPGHTPDKRK